MSEVKYLEPKKFDAHAIDLDAAMEMELTFEIGHRIAEGLEMKHASNVRELLRPYCEYEVLVVKEDWKDTFKLIVELPCTMTRIHAKALVKDLMELIEMVE